MDEEKLLLSGSLDKYNFRQADAVYSISGLSPMIQAHEGNQTGHQVQILQGKGVCDNGLCLLEGRLENTKFDMMNRVYSKEGLGVACRTYCGGDQQMKIVVERKNKMEGNKPKLRIRKLTEGECMRLMGFQEKDTESCRKAELSKANIYHQSGDSIVSTVLVGIFGELLGADYAKKIGEYADGLVKECK